MFCALSFENGAIITLLARVGMSVPAIIDHGLYGTKATMNFCRQTSLVGITVAEP
jgi:hypothetical protein